VECVVHASRVMAPTLVRMSGQEGPMEAGRRLEYSHHGTQYETHHEVSQQELQAATQLIQFLVFVVVFVIEFITVGVYYKVYIVPTASRYVPNGGRGVVVPAELKGSWKIDTFGCTEDCGTFCCFLWCAPCTWVDLWYRAGWLHAFLKGNSVSCTAWEYLAGILGWGAINFFAGGCFPCIFATLRGGLGWVDGGDGGISGIVPLRQLFGIVPHNGCSTFFEDCCCYMWCGACLGTQEYVQIKALLDKAPLEITGVQAQQGPYAAGVVVVGQPVVAGNLVEDNPNKVM